jgi:ureidoglycolate lyase
MGHAMRVTAGQLTAEAFRPFGQVIPTRVAAIGRRAGVAALENRRPAAHPTLALARIAPTAAPLRAGALERHPFSSQTFVPTDLSRYLVVVCPSGADGEPVVERLLAFVADGTQGVNYAPGTWHHPMTVLDRPGEYLVLRWDEGTAADTEWRQLPAPVLIELPDDAPCGR